LRAKASGTDEPLGPEERGMLRSVLWHRDEAVPAYLELPYDPELWKRYAESFAQQHKLMLSPLLALMAHQLARLAARRPKINSVIVGERRRRYDQVNLGFTVQADETLYLVVVQQAGDASRLDFVRALTDLQRKAMGHRLAAQELDGATVGFTSMERWQVSRHMPILPPHVSLMVAHTSDGRGNALLGATYDHRLLTGGDAVAVLRQLATPLTDSEI
jgi:pyruvate dehydrogenase E2 component (dihydrolipoamide acetyltransferase)